MRLSTYFFITAITVTISLPIFEPTRTTPKKLNTLSSLSSHHHLPTSTSSLSPSSKTLQSRQGAEDPNAWAYEIVDPEGAEPARPQSHELAEGAATGFLNVFIWSFLPMMMNLGFDAIRMDIWKNKKKKWWKKKKAWEKDHPGEMYPKEPPRKPSKWKSGPIGPPPPPPKTKVEEIDRVITTIKLSPLAPSLIPSPIPILQDGKVNYTALRSELAQFGPPGNMSVNDTRAMIDFLQDYNVSSLEIWEHAINHTRPDERWWNHPKGITPDSPGNILIAEPLSTITPLPYMNSTSTRNTSSTKPTYYGASTAATLGITTITQPPYINGTSRWSTLSARPTIYGASFTSTLVTSLPSITGVMNTSSSTVLT